MRVGGACCWEVREEVGTVQERSSPSDLCSSSLAPQYDESRVERTQEEKTVLSGNEAGLVLRVVIELARRERKGLVKVDKLIFAVQHVLVDAPMS